MSKKFKLTVDVPLPDDIIEQAGVITKAAALKDHIAKGVEEHFPGGTIAVMHDVTSDDEPVTVAKSSTQRGRKPKTVDAGPPVGPSFNPTDPIPATLAEDVPNPVIGLDLPDAEAETAAIIPHARKKHAA